MTTATLTALAGQIESLSVDKMNLEEQVSDLALRLDTVGWTPASDWNNDSGMSLDALKRTSSVLTDMVATSPLLKRATELRYGYVFGRGMTFSGLKPRHDKMMENPYNAQALFSTDAWAELMRARMTDGNWFILKHKVTNEIYRIPLSEITGVVTDPNSDERVWFIQRTWEQANGEQTRNGKQQVAWYQVSTYGGTRRSTINGKPVDNNYLMFFTPFNRQVGWTFGVPDGYAAITWTMAYSEYLKNNSKLVKAYAQIAYKASTTSKKTGSDVAAQISMPGGVAGTAAMGSNTDLVPMPRAGSDVSFENGRPLAAMVAASLGVSVVALLSDPGAAGSSYGSAQTLDAPTIIVMASIQETWKTFWKEFFRNTKGEDVKVEFPSIENDQVYRQVQSLQAAYTTGAINQKEYRASVLDLLDVVPTTTAVPKPDNFNLGHLTPQEVADNAQAQADAAAAATATASNGDQGETNNDNRTDTLSTGDHG